MKMFTLVLLLVSMNGYAQESSKTKSPESNVEKIVKKSKHDRKKKVEMCHECGKPEEQCDCKGEEHKKDE
jgi:hypothetical protein